MLVDIHAAHAPAIARFICFSEFFLCNLVQLYICLGCRDWSLHATRPEAASMLDVRREVMECVDDESDLRMIALKHCFYEGFNNGFCNVYETFEYGYVESNHCGDAAEALKYLAENGIQVLVRSFSL